MLFIIPFPNEKSNLIKCRSYFTGLHWLWFLLQSPCFIFYVFWKCPSRTRHLLWEILKKKMNTWSFKKRVNMTIFKAMLRKIQIKRTNKDCSGFRFCWIRYYRLDMPVAYLYCLVAQAGINCLRTTELTE